MKFIPLINVKISTAVVDILTFISRINITSEWFPFNEQWISGSLEYSFLCLTELSMKFIPLINVKISTAVVVILTFISRINITSEWFPFNEQWKFHAMILS